MTVKVALTNRFAYFVQPYPHNIISPYFQFHPEGYTFMPSYRAGAWDGYIRMLKWHRVPTGLFHFRREAIEKDQGIRFVVDASSIEHVPFSSDGLVSDRSYQNECVEKMIGACWRGGGIVLNATGTGKTYTTAILFSRLKGSACFVVDELTLLKQAKEEIENSLKVPVGEVGDSKFDPKRITIATVQTMHLHRKAPKFIEWTKNLKVIVIDEIHTAMNRRNFETITKILPPAVLGLTATLALKQKPVWMKALGLAGQVCYEYPLEKGVREGYLAKGIACQILYSGTIPETGSYTYDYTDCIVGDKDRENVVRFLTLEALRRGNYVVILVERVQHLKNLSAAFQAEKVPHCVVYGEVNANARVDAKKEFERGEIRLIIANKVFKKGVNIKRVDVIIDAAALKSKNDAVQKYGRGIRMCEGKKGLLYFDVADVGNRFEKATMSRRRAYKAKGIRFKKVEWRPLKVSVLFDKLEAVLAKQ